MKESYRKESHEVAPTDVKELNEQAVEAMTFMNEMARTGLAY